MNRIKNKIQKIILVFLSLLIVSFSIVPTALAADGTWYQQSYQEWLTKVVDKDNPTEIFGERYTYAQVQWIIYSLFAFISTGGDKELGGAVSCLMTKEAPECADALKGIQDVLKTVNENTTYIPKDKSIAGFFKSKSVSGIGYVLNTAEKFSIVPVAQAQTGFGYTANNVIMQLWKAVRDISYLLLTIVVVVLAFMIMFKVKINPQTVISIQSALPRVVVAIILITFSYAIAGFLIDIMYIVLGIVSAFLIRSNISSDSWTNLFYFITTGANVLWLFLNYFIAFIIAIFLNKFLLVLGAGYLVNVATGGAGLFLLILLLIIGIVIIFVQIFKTVVLLLKTFVQISLSIVVAPLQILLGTINPQLGFSSWLRNMAGNLAVYPVVTLLFILAFFFLRQSLNVSGLIDLGFLVPFKLQRSFDFSQGTWTPPFTFGTGENGYKFLLIVASVGIVSMIPKTAELIKAIIEGKPFDMQSAISEAIMKPYQGIMNWGPVAMTKEAYTRGRMQRLFEGLTTTDPDMYLRDGKQTLRSRAASLVQKSRFAEAIKSTGENLTKH